MKPSIRETTLDRYAPDPHNANAGTDRGRDVVRESLEAFGAGRSIVVANDGTILCGNKTAEQALALGLEAIEIPTDGKKLIVHRRTDIESATSEDGRGLGITDNRGSEVGLAWDPDEILAAYRDGIVLPGWDEDEIDALTAGIEDPSGLLPGADPDAVPEEVEPRCKAGDLWALGRHRVGCLDSTDRDAVLNLMDGETPGLVFADPPYGMKVVRGGKNGGDKPFGTNGGGGAVRNRPGKTVSATTYRPIIGDETTNTATAAYSLAASLFPGAVQVWWGGNFYADHLPATPCWLVWDKETTGDFADAELAWTNQTTPIRLFRHLWNGLCRDSEKGERRVHPTQKPVALAEWVFEKYGDGVDLLFDPFLGSGMSLIAAEKTGRRCFGLELSPEYVDVVIARWEAATGETARKL